MIILFTKSQLALFDAPVHVAASVRKDGTIVAPHIRIQKVAVKQHPQGSLFQEPVQDEAKKRTKLEAFIARHGGARSLAGTLAAMTEGQQKQIIAGMAALDGNTPSDIAAMLHGIEPKAAPAAQAQEFATPPAMDARVIEHDGDTWHVVTVGAARPDGTVTAHLSSTTRGRHANNGIHPVQMVDGIDRDKLGMVEEISPTLVEHVTGKGKTLRGIVRRDLTLDEAKEIDPYTFKKDGGYFIREKHLAAATPAQVVVSPAPVDIASVPMEVVDSERGTFGVPAGITKGQRREINAQVVALVTADKTEFSDADRDLMRQYSGNGGCGDSLNEFYTDPAVASAIWTTLANLGFASGTALEPSCGPGVFMHAAPAGVKVTGVELDPISADVAEALHGERHEIINSSLERFATQDAGRQFDVVIGNAPFGLRGSLIKDDKPELKNAEGYFLDTSLDKVKPGGIVAMIVPTGVIDAKSNRALRERLLRKAEFLGASRMPNTAFEHSHTEVTTDIVFFRKRADDVAGALMTVKQDALKKLGVWDDEYLSGGYFDGRGASSIYGTMEAGWRAKAGMGQDITVSGSMQGVPAEIAAWVPDTVTTATPDVMAVLDVLGDDEAAKKKALGGAMKRPYEAGKVGDTKVVDGVSYILQGRPPRWHRIDEFMQDAPVRDAQGIAADIDRLFTGQAVDRPALEERVRAYVAAHGNPGNNANLQLAASQDKILYRLIGAVSADGSLSDAVTGRVARKVEGSLDTAAQSLAVERTSGTFAVSELAGRIGKDAEEVEDALFASPAYAYAGDGQWTTTDQYLTGELWTKLDRVREEIARGDLRDGLAEKYADQAKRLEETIDPKSLEDVEILLNSAFLPTDVIAAYFNERKAASDNDWVRKQSDMTVAFDGGLYTVSGGNQYGDAKLLATYLNRTGVRKDDVPNLERMNEDFKLWLLSSRYRDQVEDLYNRKFRGFVQREFSDATIDIPGLNTEGLKQYQYSGLRWALAAGKGIIAADVGLGKTVRGLMLARMAKMNGQAQKPTFVVPKSVLANWVAEADKWFPGSRVLVIGETYTRDKAGNLKSKADTPAERNRKLHELTQNDYDFVFISQPSFNDLDLDPITKGSYINDDFWVQRGDKLGNAGDKRTNKIREAYNQAIAGREFQKRTDAIYFNDLGIDMLLVDEGHAFKNLYAARARFGESPKFLGGQGLSNRALDMNLKTRFVRENNGGNGIFMLTATPTKNSPLEIYSMLSHIAPEAFERIGIRNSEEFLDRFCEFANDKILGTDGTIQDALVTVGFKNLGELREIMKRYIDRKTAADVGLVLPSRDDRMHMIDMTPEQQGVYSDLRVQMAELATKKDATGDAHVFSIMDKMAKAAMDLELLDSTTYAGARSPKYDEAAKHISEGAKDGGQVIFAEAVGSHEKIASALVASGIPRDQIAIINGQVADSSAKRQNISDAFNAGKLKAVIGNRTMEEGMNLQKATTDIHHMDITWDPASMQQRNGRGLRQGNMNESVRVHTYISKGSFDGYRYQSMTAKKDWQDVLWNGADRVDNMAREGRFDRSDLLIMMSADPESERAKFEADKAAAQERHDGEQRRSAASEFVRFQIMKRSYRDLQNKKSTSAERLRAKLERAKTMLANNKHFSAKGALDSDNPVVIHPDTGLALQRGVGLDVKEADGSSAKWVVTDVAPTSGEVSMRRYGEVGKGGLAITVPSSKLSHGVVAYKYNEAEESAHVAEKLAAAAAENLNSLGGWDDIKAMPGAVLAANHEVIQKQIKDGTKSYKFNMPYGDIPMVNRETGDIKMAESYEHTKMHDTHDYLLPTDDAKERVIQAWMEARRGAKITTRFVTSGNRRHQKSSYVPSREYSGTKYDAKHVNPFRGLLGTLSPGESPSYGTASALEREAKSRLEAEQQQRIRRAPDVQSAIAAILPLAKVTGTEREGKASYPEKALATLWARARHLGALNTTIGSAAPQGHNTYAYSSPTTATVHSALISMARKSGHADLADAMTATAERHVPGLDDAHTVRAISSTLGSDGSFRYSKRALEHMLKIADRADMADRSIGQLRDHGLSGPFAAPSAYGYNPSGQRDAGRTLRDKINELLETAA